MADEKNDERHMAHKAEDETFKIKKVALWQGISVVLLIILAASVYTGGFGLDKGSGGSVGLKPQAVAPGQQAPNARVEVQIGDSPSVGDKNAPITLIEFSDFQCPFCGRHFVQTQPQIEEQYVKVGKVRFVYKHLPLESIHQNAMPAALASECAREQGKFWEFHDLLFQNQESLSDVNYQKWAQQLGLDMDKFNDCYSTQKYLGRVRSDIQQGSAAGITGTPGFLLNGQIISGAQPFAVFKQAIDAELVKN